MLQPTLQYDADFIISGTGARDLQIKSTAHKQEVFDWLEDKMMTLTAHVEETHDSIAVVSGMAEGFDACLAAVAIRLEIPLIAALPTPNYGQYYWGNNSLTGNNRKDKFDEYIEQAVEVIHVSDRKYGRGNIPEFDYNGGANKQRNQWMVDHAEWFYVYDKTSRGTSDCVTRIEASDKFYVTCPIQETNA